MRFLQEVKPIVRSWFLPRHLKRTVTYLLVILLLLILWRMAWQGPSYNFAVPCKARIADIMLQNAAEKKKYLKNLAIDVNTLEQDYFHAMSSQTHQCFEQVRIGPDEDGGWQVCLYHQFDIKQPCLIYSFGIGHDFRFEKGIEDMLGCEVHAFDPSMGVASHQYSERGYFHDIGIDGKDKLALGGRWKMRRLETIMKELEHTGRTIDLMKMDVEFSEWPALFDMIQSGLINNIRQLVLETHTPEMDIHIRPEHTCTWSTKETYSFMLSVMSQLRTAGFSVYYSKTNYRTMFESTLTGQNRYCCYNIHMVNKNHPKNEWIKPPGKLH